MKLAATFSACWILGPSAGFVDRIRTFHHADFPVDALVRAKRMLNSTVSVCIPAHNEETTVGLVVSTVIRHLVLEHPLVDEVVVLDDRSSDRTAAVAAAAGATVTAVSDVLPGVLSPPGRATSSGDLCTRAAPISSAGSMPTLQASGPRWSMEYSVLSLRSPTSRS